MRNIIKERSALITNIIVFIGMLIFFSKLCPITIYDSDDWSYISKWRLPIPIWGGWNPSKVLPEVLMPLCGYTAAYIIYPIIGDYFFSITFTAAVIVSALVTILCLSTYLLMKKRFQCSVSIALFSEILFLIFNFLIFRNRGTSRYMYYADNMNCIFNYTIPGIVNGIAVLVMMQYKKFGESFLTFKTWKKFGFGILIYFAIFSNIFHSCLVGIYCATMILFECIDVCRKSSWNIKRFLNKNKIYLIIIVVWLLSLFFEVNGSRAVNVTRGQEFDLETSIRQLWALINAIGIPFKIVGILSMIWLFRKIIQNFLKKKDSSIYFQMLVTLLLIMIYLLILCGIVNYMSRIEASWTIWFLLIVIVVIGIADFLSSYANTKSILILILIITGGLSLYPDGKFMMSTVKNLDYEVCVNTGAYVMNQIVEADQKRKTSIVVHSPVYEEEKFKWVFGDSFPKVVMNTLYKHGIIKNRMEIETCNDEQLINIFYDKEVITIHEDGKDGI